MKIAAIILGVIVTLFLGLLFVAPSLVPSDTYRTTIQEQLTRELGREVRIEGDVSLSTFPSIRAKTGRATIANPSGFSRDLMASIEGLEARIKLWPLLSRRVEIAGFTMSEPDILLERRADGSVNWELGGTLADSETPSEAPDGPFRRDGRYAALDPSLASLRIENGRLGYRDALANQSYDLNDVNVKLALPDMARAMSVEGDLVADGEAVAFDMTLDSPRAFLNGAAAQIDGTVTMESGRLSVDGTFPESDAILFSGNLSARLSDLRALETYLSEPVPALSLLDSLEVEAVSAPNLQDGSNSFQNIDLSAIGPDLDLSYQGQASLGDILRASGRYTVETGNPSRIAAVLAPDMQGADAMSRLTSSGEIAVAGQAVRLTSLQAEVSGPELTASATGNLSVNGPNRSGSGTFEARISDAAALGQRFVSDLPQDAAAAGRVQLAGTYDLNGETITLTNLDMTSESPVQSISFFGDASLSGETVSLDGNVEGTIPSLSALNEALTAEIPNADSLGRAEFETQIAGTPDALTLDGLVASLTDGRLEGRLTGTATKTGDVFGLTGRLSARTDDLRAVALANGVDLPPSTEAGPIFRRFKLDSAVSGDTTDLRLSELQLELDEMTATGSAALSLAGETPCLTGDLSTSALDLRPYMSAYSAQRPQGGLQPWSQEAIPTETLDALQSRIGISAPSVTLSRIELGRTDATLVLENGVLSTDVSQMALYGGQGSGTFTLDGRRDTPSIAVDATLGGLQTRNFLTSIAGFDKATGTGAATVSLRGTGSSQDAIMRSLSGNGRFTLEDGALQGIDASEFMSGLQTALTSRTLPGGIGPSKTTPFQLINGQFDMSGGVASLNQFSLSSSTVAVEGSGQVDLGNQSLDIRLRPKSVGASARGLAAFGIPIRFRGPFGSASPSLDSDFLGQVVQAQAASQAQRLIGNALGGGSQSGTPSPANDLLGSILGGSEPQAGGSETAEEAEPEEEEPSTEDTLLELFGVRRR